MASSREQALTGVVVGMKALTGQVKPRLDIDVLLTQHPDIFNLMLQAISEMQKNPDPKLGYYALAGIHLLPTSPWDEVTNKFAKGSDGGYCAHGVLTFPTWHRPYLALFEQTIYLKMVDIANRYNEPHRARYVAACNDFRLPYLDYFRPRDGQVQFPGVAGNVRSPTTSFPYNFRLPDVFNAKTINVYVAPDDSLNSNFTNPLYSYKFSEATGQLPPRDQQVITRRFSTKQTLRYPKSLNADTHDLGEQSNYLNSGREGRTALTLKLLNSKPYRDLTDVASDRVPDDELEQGDMTEAPDVTPTRGSGSLEGSVHGNYHWLIGGQRFGHMSDPIVAAFDPVFWFHHANIDRYWSLWAAMHPKAWFPQPGGGSGKEPENKKDLLPFYKSRDGPGKGVFYNSDDAKTTEPFGYYYDDFEGSPEKEALWSRFTSKYAWSVRSPDHPQVTEPPTAMAPLKVQESQFFRKGGKPAVQPVFKAASAVTSKMTAAAEPLFLQAQAIVNEITPAAVLPPGMAKIDPKFDRDWYVDSRVLRSASNGSFTIFFFLALSGELNEDPATFGDSPFLAGVNHIFAAPREQCDNCGRLEAAGQHAADTLLITPLLLDYLDLPDNGLESLRPEHVKKFLVKYLRWRVVYHGEDLQNTRQVPDLTVGVSAEVSHDDGSKTYETYPDVVETILANASSAPTSATA